VSVLVLTQYWVVQLAPHTSSDWTR
jgi:hypothetical protein